MHILPVLLVLPALLALVFYSGSGDAAAVLEPFIGGGEFEDEGMPAFLFSRAPRAPMDRSAMVRFGKRAVMDESIGPASMDRWTWFGKRAPMDRSAMVRFGKRAPMDRSAMVRFGKRAPMDRSAMVRFGKRAPMDRSAMVRFGRK